MTAHAQATLPDGAAWEPAEPEDTVEYAVLSMLRMCPNRTTRFYLATLTGYSDRTVREAIEGLRRAGWLILAEPRGGYRLATTREDQELLLRQMRGRAIALSRTYHALKRSVLRRGA